MFIHGQLLCFLSIARIAAIMKTFARREAARWMGQGGGGVPRIVGRRVEGCLFANAQKRGFKESRRLDVVKPYLLADIGEGMSIPSRYCELVELGPGRLMLCSLDRYHGVSGYTVVRQAWGEGGAV